MDLKGRTQQGAQEWWPKTVRKEKNPSQGMTILSIGQGFIYSFVGPIISGLRAFPAEEKREASLWEASLFSCQNRTT